MSGDRGPKGEDDSTEGGDAESATVAVTGSVAEEESNGVAVVTAGEEASVVVVTIGEDGAVTATGEEHVDEAADEGVAAPTGGSDSSAAFSACFSLVDSMGFSVDPSEDLTVDSSEVLEVGLGGDSSASFWSGFPTGVGVVF